MKLTQVIEHFQTLLKEYGDIPVLTGTIGCVQPALTKDLGTIISDKGILKTYQSIEWNPNARPSCDIEEHNLLV